MTSLSGDGDGEGQKIFLIRGLSMTPTSRGSLEQLIVDPALQKRLLQAGVVGGLDWVLKELVDKKKNQNTGIKKGGIHENNIFKT